MKLKMLLTFTAFTFIAAMGFSEDNKILAVTNIEAVEVNEFMAATVRDMIEAALIKTDKFQVINYSNMKEILEVQALSLSGCTDDSCAVEIGKLLSAEEIVIGTLSKIDERLILSVRLIDVESGHNIQAEVGNIDSLDSLQEDVFKVAYKLIGLRYFSESEYQITDKGSLYITAPNGMKLDVSIDGDSKGETPILIEDIPFGTHVIEATSGSYIFEDDITVNTKDVIEILADASLFKGNILLNIKPDDALEYSVFVDGNEYKVNLIRDITVGKHKVIIKGREWYYDGEITVEKNKTANVDTILQPIGYLTIEVPQDAEASVIDENDNILYRSAEINSILLLTGNYKIVIEHPDYVKYESNVEILRGEETSLTPLLTYSKLYNNKKLLAEYEQELEAKNSNREIFNIVGTSLTVAGIISAGLTGFTEYLLYTDTEEINTLYSDYSSTELSSEAASLWSTIENKKNDITNMRIYRDIALYSAGGFAAGAIISFLLQPAIEELENSIENLKLEINK